MLVLWITPLIFLLCYFIVFGQNSRFASVRSARDWVTGDGLKTLGYLVPLGYAIIMAYSLYLFDSSCAPNLGKVHRNVCRVLYLLPFSSMALCVCSDPGVINKNTHYKAMRAYKYDRILFMPHVECRTCRLAKPARSKHCSVCNSCFELLDHHCIWINNCVGRNNYRYFMYFLVSHLFIFGYGLWLLVPMLGWDQPAEAKGFFAFFVAKMRGMIKYHQEAVCLALLCLLIGWITAIFTAYTLYFVYLGVTTNEYEKWDDINDLIADKALWIYQLPQDIYGGSIVLQKYDDGTFNRSLTSYEQALVDQNQAPLVPVQGFEDLNNIYDQGFWSNLRDMLGIA